MFRDILSNKGVLAALLFCVLIVVGSQLYSWHVKRGIQADEARTQRFLQQIETNKKKARATAQIGNIDTDSASKPNTPVAPEGGAEKVSEETVSEQLGDAEGTLDVADAFKLDETAEEDTVEVPISPYGFGPYPELPEGWPSRIWPRESANSELITRVQIKLAHQGINALGGIMENGLVYPAIPGTVYVDWKERRDGSLFISDMTGDPEAASRLQSMLESKGNDFTEADIPSDIELLPFSGGGIDPYEFLDLPRR